MEKIKLSFVGTSVLDRLICPTYKVVLTMDDQGKRASLEIDEDSYCPEDIKQEFGESRPVELPKRVMKAFTAHAIDNILSKDEIPEDLGCVTLDGNSYTIVITKGNLTKEYDADDVTVDMYPLLRYLASWYRREMMDIK